MEFRKKEWKEPVLEVLNVSMTMAGTGTKYIDFVTKTDFDITDTPTPWPLPPGVGPS
jgi:hypothetical protein